MPYSPFRFSIVFLLLLTSCSTARHQGASRVPSAEDDDLRPPRWNHCELFLSKRAYNALHFAQKRSFDPLLTRDAVDSLDEFSKTNNQAHVPAEALIGQAMEFEEMIGWVIHQMPRETRLKLFEMVDAFAKTEITIERHEGILAKTIDLKQPFNIYRPFAVGANKGSRVIWSTDPIGDLADLHFRAEKALDMLALARLAPVHKFAVYRASQNRFVRENLKLLTDAIIQKAYLFEKYPTLVPPPKSKVKRALRMLESFLVAFSPYNWTGVAPAEFNTRYRDILETKGPQGVYRELVKTRGIALGVEYWYTHLANSYQLIGVVILGVIVPQLNKLFDDMGGDDDDEEKTDQLVSPPPPKLQELGTSLIEFWTSLDKGSQGTPLEADERRIARAYLAGELKDRR